MHNHRNISSCQGHRRRLETSHWHYLGEAEGRCDKAQAFKIGLRNSLDSATTHRYILISTSWLLSADDFGAGPSELRLSPPDSDSNHTTFFAVQPSPNLIALVNKALPPNTL